MVSQADATQRRESWRDHGSQGTFLVDLILKAFFSVEYNAFLSCKYIPPSLIFELKLSSLHCYIELGGTRTTIELGGCGFTAVSISGPGSVKIFL